MGEPGMIAKMSTMDDPSNSDFICAPSEKHEMEAELPRICLKVPVIVPPLCFGMGVRGDQGSTIV